MSCVAAAVHPHNSPALAGGVRVGAASAIVTAKISNVII
jgi:hypothetical protein